jgi:putative tryptophan/tyrosine transport system substrate-binding protein
MIKRREFIAGVAGAAAWPLAARGQQAAMPVIGYLSARAASENPQYLLTFLQGLREAGYVEGQNVLVEYRWADGQYDRLPALTIDLVSRRVAVIFALDNASAQVAKPASATIPIVFAVGADPVNLGLVASLNRPGGNITGVSFLSTAVVAKMLELLHEAVPSAAIIAVLVNPGNPNGETDTREAQEAARILGLQVLVLHASNDREIDAAFATLVERRAGALLAAGDAFFGDRRDRLAALSARHAIPMIMRAPEFARAGGLMGYGANQAEAIRLAGGYVGRILKGVKPADLPVQLSTKVDLVINLKTAKALGLTIPETLLATADEVIQ